MIASIKQNPSTIPIGLPDFRNLGVSLRILLLANAMAAVAAALRSETWPRAWQELLEISSAMQPVLLLCLLILYALNRWLHRLPYHLAAALVIALAMALTVGINLLAGHLLGPGFAPSTGRSWFFALVISGALLIYFDLRGRALSPAITEARLQALQARIRPHFLFNSINAVLSLIRSDPRRAETALEDMADLFRVLMADNRSLVPLQDEVALCRQYLDLEKLRLEDRLQLDWRIDEMPGDALIPPLLLQPLLENAVYHGIEPFQEGGLIRIELFRRGKEVHMVLTNPFRAEGDHHSGNRMALANIRERLALHFDAEAQLNTEVSADHYRVHIIMPYRTSPL